MDANTGEHEMPSTAEKHDQVDTNATDLALAEVEHEYPTGLRFFLIMFSINISALITALEIGIIATAIPAITDDFHALNDVGWYGSATFLTTAATSAPWGKIYKYFRVEYAYTTAIAIFLLGSVIAGAAPNSIALIVGRAFQGLGITGAINGSIIVINYVSRPQLHPVLIGIWTGIFMVSTILGPIVGGALTSGVTWRWCFYINLPVGGAVLILLVLTLRMPKHIKPTPATWKEIVLQIDLPGFSLVLASLICFILALQRGGQTEPWNNGVVIATLVLWIFFTIAFVFVEKFEGARAMVPWNLMMPRMTWANALYCFVNNLAFYQVLFYLSIYLQAVRGDSAIMSGVDSLPFLALFAVGAVAGGGAVGKTRYLQPFQLASALIMTAGAALLYTLDENSSKSRYMGAEVLFGFGAGLGNQIPMMAVQGLSDKEDVPNTTGIMFMAQSASAAYFIVIAQSIFANRLVTTLETTAPGLSASQVAGTGVTDLRNTYSGQDLQLVLGAYMVGIKDVFVCALAGSALAVLLALVIPFKKLPDHDKKAADEKAGQDEEIAFEIQ